MSRLPHPARTLRRRLREERGFTLIEMLIATLAGIIVTAAMGAIMIVTVHFSSNVNDRVDANQEGRVAMEKITQALNSSCVAAGVTPIQAGSDWNHLIFYSALADTPAINPNLLEVELTGGSLTMLTNDWVSGTGPTGSSGWSFSPTVNSTFTLLPYATNETVNSASVPVFQYYGYGSNGALTTNLDPTDTTLTAATAAQVAEVVITFESFPSYNWNATGRAADIADSVVLRLTPASDQSTATNAPCS